MARHSSKPQTTGSQAGRKSGSSSSSKDPKSCQHTTAGKKSKVSTKDELSENSAKADAAAFARIQEDMRTHISTDRDFGEELKSTQDRVNLGYMRITAKSLSRPHHSK